MGDRWWKETEGYGDGLGFGYGDGAGYGSGGGGMGLTRIPNPTFPVFALCVIVRMLNM
jgi:hypothetical protein